MKLLREYLNRHSAPPLDDLSKKILFTVMEDMFQRMGFIEGLQGDSGDVTREEMLQENLKIIRSDLPGY
jgi:hypothetical protein